MTGLFVFNHTSVNILENNISLKKAGLESRQHMQTVWNMFWGIRGPDPLMETEELAPSQATSEETKE